MSDKTFFMLYWIPQSKIITDPSHSVQLNRTTSLNNKNTGYHLEIRGDRKGDREERRKESETWSGEG